MAERVLTQDGLETTFAVNHLPHFLLTHLLLDLLKRSAPWRIITVSSIAHMNARLDLENLQGEKGFDGYGAYAVSKLANVLFTYELADRLRGSGVTANCLHPGVIGTKLLWKGFGRGGKSVAKGAETMVYLASAPEMETVSGKYFDDVRPLSTSRASNDPSLRRKLWEESEKLAGLV